VIERGEGENKIVRRRTYAGVFVGIEEEIMGKNQDRHFSQGTPAAAGPLFGDPAAVEEKKLKALSWAIDRAFSPVAEKAEKDITARKHQGADTSQEAFDSVGKIARSRQRLEVHKFIASEGSRGATLEEISKALDLPIQSASARVSELRRDGMIFDQGRRPTVSGRTARVHFAEEAKT
jgi:hypothetical protein